MIIWGGQNATTYLNDGGRYNPTTDTWGTAPTTTGAPTARNYHSAVWNGFEMLIWGGSTAANTYEDSGGRYDPAIDADPVQSGMSWMRLKDGNSLKPTNQQLMLERPVGTTQQWQKDDQIVLTTTDYLPRKLREKDWLD